MSHFKVLVLIPQNSDVQQAVKERLAPYDENMEVEPYRVVMDAERRARMVEVYQTDDNTQLAQSMVDWNHCSGGVDEDGQLYYVSTYNPQSKWDWWSIGGRYSGVWHYATGGCSHEDRCDRLACNVKPVVDLPEQWSAFAIVTENGEWHAQAEMSWFAATYNEKEQNAWDAERFEIMSGHTKCLAVIVDCHI